MSNIKALGSFVAVLRHYWATCTLDDIRQMMGNPELTDGQAEAARKLHSKPPFGRRGVPDEVMERATRLLVLEKQSR